MIRLDQELDSVLQNHIQCGNNDADDDRCCRHSDSLSDQGVLIRPGDLAELSLKKPLRNKEKAVADIGEFCNTLFGAFSVSEVAAAERAGIAADEMVKAVESELADMVAEELRKKKENERV